MILQNKRRRAPAKCASIKNCAEGLNSAVFYIKMCVYPKERSGSYAQTRSFRHGPLLFRRILFTGRMKRVAALRATRYYFLNDGDTPVTVKRRKT